LGVNPGQASGPSVSWRGSLRAGGSSPQPASGPAGQAWTGAASTVIWKAEKSGKITRCCTVCLRTTAALPMGPASVYPPS